MLHFLDVLDNRNCPHCRPPWRILPGRLLWTPHLVFSGNWVPEWWGPFPGPEILCFKKCKISTPVVKLWYVVFHSLILTRKCWCLLKLSSSVLRTKFSISESRCTKETGKSQFEVMLCNWRHFHLTLHLKIWLLTWDGITPEEDIAVSMRQVSAGIGFTVN